MLIDQIRSKNQRLHTLRVPVAAAAGMHKKERAMDYKFKVTYDKIDEVLEHMVEYLGIHVYDSVYDRRHECAAIELKFNANEGSYRQEWWDNDLECHDSYSGCLSTEITQEQFLQMSFEDLESGNIPVVYENLKITNIESREQFDLLKDILSRKYSTVQIEYYYKGIENFSNIHIFTETSGGISHCDSDCTNCFSIEKDDCLSRTVVTARDFIQKNIEKEKKEKLNIEQVGFEICEDGALAKIKDCQTGPPVDEEKKEPLNIETLGFKIGDEVYIKAKIESIIDFNDTFIVNYASKNNASSRTVLRKDQLLKSTPDNKLAGLNAVVNIVEQYNGLVDSLNKKADLETIENVNEHMSKLITNKKHSSSIMMGNIDLSEEIADEEILKNRERKQ